MKQLLNIAYHKVATYWDKLAYNLKFSIGEVNTVRVKYKNDPLECCLHILKEWRCTKHGDTKTWSVFLAAVRKTKPLYAIATQIEDDVIKM